MKINIQTKLISYITIVIFFIAIVAILLASQAVSKGFTEEMLKMGQVVVNELAEQIANPLITGDTPKIELLIFRAKQENENIEYIFLLNREKHIMASTLQQEYSSKYHQISF